jgi:hypothetical protein
MGEFKKFISSLDYLIGCWLLIPASICLIYSDKYIYESIIFYIVSCGFLLKAAIIDFISLFKKLPLKSNSISSKDINLISTVDELESTNLVNSSNNSDECLNKTITVAYLLGGLFFELGSILYWPTFSTGRLGTWVFRFGSLCYLTGTITFINVILNPYNNSTSIKENKKPRKNPSFYIVIGCLTFYAFGAICFIIGGIMSETHYLLSGEVWLVGSIWFAIGSTLGFVDRIINY